MNYIEVSMSGFIIRLVKDDDGSLRPYSPDLAKGAALYFLTDRDQLEIFIRQLTLDRFESALKFVCYHADLLQSIARGRIIRFLLMNLSCLINFCDTQQAIEENMEIFVPFICGMYERKLTNKQVLELIDINEFGVDYDSIT